MSRHVLSFIALLTLITNASAQIVPLTDRRYNWPDLPYKVDTDTTGRGPQFGYNLCNSTTEGPKSDCQTALMNHIDQFCLWGPPLANSTIADTEAETVAWCTKPGQGARTMPAGTLTGVQVLIAPAYILFSGTFNQTGIDMTSDDYGGEMDPHGADERGNPLGSLVYTNAFPSNGGNNNTYQQVIEWHNFVGSNVYCFKICDPSVANSQVYCNNVFDRTGCSFVAPAPYKQGDFSVCDSDNMDPVGVYTGSNGIVSTYSQPPDGVPITSLPPVKTPNSSNCVTYTSSVLYAQETWSTLGGASTPTTGASSGTGTVTSKPTGTSSKSGSGNSGSPSSSKSSTSGAAMRGVSVPGSSLWAAGSGVFIAMGMTLVAGLMTVVVAL
jgi:hypothetical protein